MLSIMYFLLVDRCPYQKEQIFIYTKLYLPQAAGWIAIYNSAQGTHISNEENPLADGVFMGYLFLFLFTFPPPSFPSPTPPLPTLPYSPTPTTFPSLSPNE